jgi:Uncharacterized ABC-type transport system, permease components
MKTLEQRFHALLEKADHPPTSLKDVFQILASKGRSLVLIFLCLPFCQPIQIPGLSTPFGLAIAFVGLRMAFGKHLWLPKKLLNKHIPARTLKKVANTSLRFIKKGRRWIHPRMEGLCTYSAVHHIHGVLVCILGILLALPLPVPFSNLVTAWPIMLIALGTLEDDGLCLLIGYILTLVAFAFFGVVAFSIDELIIYEHR